MTQIEMKFMTLVPNELRRIAESLKRLVELKEREIALAEQRLRVQANAK